MRYPDVPIRMMVGGDFSAWLGGTDEVEGIHHSGKCSPAKCLLMVVVSLGLILQNGKSPAMNGGQTWEGPKGNKTTIDYVWLSPALDKVGICYVGPLYQKLSDHAPLVVLPCIRKVYDQAYEYYARLGKALPRGRQSKCRIFHQMDAVPSLSSMSNNDEYST